MNIPFVIDNQQHTMVEVLNSLLAEHKGHSLDVATAYFNVGGWQLLRHGLEGLGNVRLLLGDEPEASFDLGLREVGARPVKGLIRELANANFNEQTLRLVEDLIAFLQQAHVQVRLYTQGFLHAKCYLFYSGGGFAHFSPIAAIVGSSNFTRAGLQSNKELNLSHRANLTPEELSSEHLKGSIEDSERKVLGQMAEAEHLIAANVPGVLAIQEIDLLSSTDVLSEGQNLQDCGVLINYDLHWNPARMVQRAGRIDRIGTSFEILWVMNMFPDDGAETREGV